MVLVLLAAGLPLSGSASAEPETDLQWTNTNAPAGGPVGAIAGNGDVLVAGMWREEGAYLSRDNGINWEKITDFPPIIEVHNAAWSPHDSDVGFVSGYGGLARTTDGGDTWDHVVSDVTVTGPVVFHPTQDLIAINHRPQGTWDLHVLVSDDNGDTWTDLGAPGTGLQLSGIAFGPTPDHIYTMRNFQGWVTTDGGGTWQEQSDGGSSLAQTNDGTFWRAGMGPLRKSTDHGLTWQEVPLPVESNPRLVTPRPDGGLYATTSDGILLTTDGGGTWTNLGFGEATWGSTDIFVDPRNPEAVFLTDENVGVVWVGPSGSGYRLEGRTNGFPPVPVNTLGASGNGDLLLAGGSYGTYGSRDGGTTWTHLGPGMGMGSTRAVSASDDGQYVYAGGQTLFFFPWLAYSQDGGNTWDFASINIGGDGYVAGIATHPDDPQTAWIAVWGDFAPSHVFETTDGGTTWEAILVSTDKVQDVTYHAASGSVLVATSIGVQARDPVSGAWTVVSPGMNAAKAVASDAAHAYAVGQPTQAYRTLLPAAAISVPWATTQNAARDVAPDGDGGAWIVHEVGTMELCQSAGGTLLPGATCSDQTPPEQDVYAALVRPDGDRVFAATLASGLWSAET